MYNLLKYRKDEAVLQFTFTVSGNEDHEWHHSALAVPLLRWYDDLLRPLARDLGDHLTAKEVVGCIRDLASADMIPLASIDWLGLALVAVRAYAEAVAALAEQDSQELEQHCSTSAILAEKLCQISEESLWILDGKLHEYAAAAA